MSIRIIIPFLICSLTACISTKKYNQQLKAKHSIKELKTDLSIIKTSLEQVHPGIYWYIPKEKLDFKFDSIQNSIKDSMTSLDFYRMAAPIVSELKCGHTRLIYPNLILSKEENKEAQKKGPPPLNTLQYNVEDDKIFIVANKGNASNTIIPRAQIISIDSVTVKQILEKTKKIIASDGYNSTYSNAVLNKVFCDYYYLAFAKKDSNILEIRDSSGLSNVWLKTEKREVEKQKIVVNNTKKEKQEEIVKNKLIKKNKYKGLDENKQPILDYKVDTTLKSTAILKIKSFMLSYKNTNKFLKESFKSIEENKIDNLILDLRDNGGGNILNDHLLFRYLYSTPHKFTARTDMKTRFFTNQKYIQRLFNKKFLDDINRSLFIKRDSLGYYKKLSLENDNKALKHHFDGNLTVLINGLSFSTTSLLAANLQSVKRGFFIGEETGGGYNQCSGGTFPIISLPNTGLNLRVPDIILRIENTRALVGRGVFPDLEIKPTLEDVIKGNDVVMEKAKELINIKALSLLK